jgi:predicted MFS family arabinose efflux permease
VSRHLAVLTGAKVVTNVAYRWLGPFLPTLERAFGTSTSTLTTVMGAGEVAGLSTTATGRVLDRGHERRALVAGLLVVAVSSIVATIGTVAAFAVAYAILVVGVANFTVAGHAWIAHRVPYSQRGRSIGIFETSWAIALLAGAPIVALLIHVAGWRGPFVATSVGCVVAAAVVWRAVPPDVPRRSVDEHHGGRLPADAWPPILASASTAAAGLSVFVVSGAYLADRHDVSTTILGVVAALFGALELTASAGAARFTDRIGKRRSVGGGLVVLAAGLAVVAVSSDRVVLAVVGLTVFLTGFEFAFVSSLSLVSEAAPASRGRALGVSNSVGTLARSAGVLLSGLLYDAVGMGGSLLLSCGAAAVAGGLVLVTRTEDRLATDVREQAPHH